MAFTSRAIFVAFLGLLGYFISTRSRTLWSFYGNHPSRLPSISNIDYEIKFADITRNCEDGILDEANSILILSCDPGRDKWNTVMGTFIDENDARGKLYWYKYTDPESKPTPIKLEKVPATAPKALHPLGVGFWAPTRTLYMVSHAEPASIYVFKLSQDGTAATYIRRLEHPLLQTPNSVAPISDHEIYFTNDHQFKIRDNFLLAKLETYLAYAGGSVVYMDTATGSAKTVAHTGFANGVTTLPGGRLAVASTTGAAIHIYNIDAATKGLALNRTLPVAFLVDNLKTDSNGVLLAAGHPFGPALEAVATTNREFDLDGTGEPGLKPEGERPRALSWVAEWDGNEEGKLKDLYVGSDYGCSATALRDGKTGWGFILGLYEKGIMQWKDKK